ncbi:Transposon Ty1-A Gag-Pol polyprotein [Porphyridium purpureum]|uniref:Transposon Ty1-A Gag-Pol polyprotein n=1 Tax=Porphyridium purpureum TaxID=35688 RepID=A0A5J4YR56_PORPP|nr:Transposon Ty1-A Gag-Pol polyprotein [Porphyridium purpureum]|eukprot:POR3728..scf296_7
MSDQHTPRSSSGRATPTRAAEVARASGVSRPPVRESSNSGDSRSLLDTGVVAPAWWPSSLRINDEVGDLLQMAVAAPNDFIEMLMVEQVVTVDWLMARGGPVSVQAWIEFCRERGIPNFEPGTSVRTSFQRFSIFSIQDELHHTGPHVAMANGLNELPGANASSTPGARAASQQPATRPELQQPIGTTGSNELGTMTESSGSAPPGASYNFIRFMAESRFTGEPGSVPFSKWVNRLKSAREIFGVTDAQVSNALPLITAGQAESLLHSRADQCRRLGQKLSLLEKTFSSESARSAYKQMLKSANFATFEREGTTRERAFDVLVKHVENICSFLGQPYDSPDQVADYVIQAMYASDYAPALSLVKTRDSVDTLAELRVFLSQLDARKGRLLPGNETSGVYLGHEKYNGPSGPRKRDDNKHKTVQTCSFCGLRGHEEPRCWKKYGRPLAKVALVDGVDGQDEHEQASSERTEETDVLDNDGAFLVSDAIYSSRDVYQCTGSVFSVGAFRGFCIDTGAPSCCGLEQWKAYCDATGQPNTLLPCDRTLVWGVAQKAIGCGSVRIPVTNAKFLSWNVPVVQHDLPMLVGLDLMQAHNIKVDTASAKLEIPGHDPVHLFHAQGKLWIRASDCDVICYTTPELSTLHRRFGHAHHEQLRAVLSRAGEPLTNEEAKELKRLCAECPVCQWYAGRRSRYRASADISVEFNDHIVADFFWLEHGEPVRKEKVLHIICAGTRLQVAFFVPTTDTALDTFRRILSCWFVPFGLPRKLHCDQDNLMSSQEFIRACTNLGTQVEPVAIEAHWSVGLIERQHGPLRKVFSRVLRDAPNLERDAASRAEALSLSVFAVNSIQGIDGLVPYLLAFGTIPRVPLHPGTVPPTQAERLAVAFAARDEYERHVAVRRVREARRAQTPEFPRQKDGPLPGKAVLVRRTSGHEWSGPYHCAGVNPPQVSVLLPPRGRRATYHECNVKIFQPENDTGDPHAGMVYGLEPTLYYLDPSDDFREADLKELQGLARRGLFDTKTLASNGANVLSTRMIRTRKADGTMKSRLVVQGDQRDRQRGEISLESPTVSRVSQRVLASLAVTFKVPIAYRDYSQAYVQSTYKLSRDVFVRFRPQDQRDLEDILGPMPNPCRLVYPLYGLQESGTYWYSSLKAQLQNNGFRPTALDSAFLRHETNEGAAGTVVDDVIVCGSPLVMEAEAQCAKNFDNKGRTGPPFTFSGIEYSRRGECILLSQANYITGMSARRKGASFRDFRSLRGQLSYVAHAVRPDCLATAAISSQVTEEQFHPCHMTPLNRKVRELLESPDRGLVFVPLQGTDFCIRAFGDASYATNADKSSQMGVAVFLGTRSGDRVHPLVMNSNKTNRVTYSVLGAELLALCVAFDWAESLQVELQHLLGADIPISLATDSQSLFSCIASKTTLDEKRLMIRLLVLREGFDQRHIDELALVPGRLNVADPLTKIMRSDIWTAIMTDGILPRYETSRVYFCNDQEIPHHHIHSASHGTL